VILRKLTSTALQAAEYYPVVTITGPRQSGKTTLCRSTWPDRPYVSLEPLDVRSWATEDPRSFIEHHLDGAIIDEVQHAPGLMSYLQDEVDRDPAPGRFVLTGSQNLALMEGVSQSLAGRAAVLQLLPPDLEELRRFPDPPTDLWTTLWTGAYPRIHDRGVPAGRWLSDYVTTYVQRDVRQVLAVGDLLAFDRFVRLVAGRTGQLLNLSGLGGDAGVSHNTARSWLSVLETGFLVQRLPAWLPNVRKRLTRSPKLHLLDSGLACNLLGIGEPEQLRTHPLRGPIFESWAVSELLKARLNAGLDPCLFHYREPRGPEVDVLLDEVRRLVLVETRSGSTFSASFLRGLRTLEERLSSDPRPRRRVLLLGGGPAQRREGTDVLPWDSVGRILSEP